jgi:cytochrome b
MTEKHLHWLWTLYAVVMFMWTWTEIGDQADVYAGFMCMFILIAFVRTLPHGRE